MKRKWVIFCILLTMAWYSLIAEAVMPVVDTAAIGHLIKQVALLKKEAQYLEAELMQLKDSQYQWSNAQTLINQLGEVVEKSKGLAYSAATLDKQFKRNYPGYEAPNDFSLQYQRNLEKSIHTINGMLQSMGLSAKDFKQENARLAFLQKQSQHAKGQTQAIQASSQIASEAVSQLQLLRQTMIAEANAEGVYFATQLQKEASQQAEMKKMLHRGSTKVPRYGSSGHALAIPPF